MNHHPGAPTPVQEAQHRITEAFNEYFDAFGIRIGVEDAAVGTRRTVRQDGWAITYRVDDDPAGGPILKFCATHRLTNDRHVVISPDGQLEHLDAIREMIFDPDNPGSQEPAAEEFHTHNQAIEDQRRARGLYPHGQTQRYL